MKYINFRKIQKDAQKELQLPNWKKTLMRSSFYSIFSFFNICHMLWPFRVSISHCHCLGQWRSAEIFKSPLFIYFYIKMCCIVYKLYKILYIWFQGKFTKILDCLRQDKIFSTLSSDQLIIINPPSGKFVYFRCSN